jgi:hypothetical protein
MKFLIEVDLDGYDDVKQYEEACIECVSSAMSDYCHAEVTILWNETLDNEGLI